MQTVPAVLASISILRKALTLPSTRDFFYWWYILEGPRPPTQFTGSSLFCPSALFFFSFSHPSAHWLWTACRNFKLLPFMISQHNSASWLLLPDIAVSFAMGTQETMIYSTGRRALPSLGWGSSCSSFLFYVVFLCHCWYCNDSPSLLLFPGLCFSPTSAGSWVSCKVLLESWSPLLWVWHFDSARLLLHKFL